MRFFVLLALLGTASASAQVSADSLARLDAEIARTEVELAALAPRIQSTRDSLDSLRATEDALDAERVAFQSRIRTYRTEADSLRAETARVRATYERLRDGGSEADLLAYQRDRAALRAGGDRLGSEARQLNAWQADLDERYRLHAAAVREVAEAGRALIVERRRVNEAAVTLAARRARLGASAE